MYSFKIKIYEGIELKTFIGFAPGNSLREAFDNVILYFGENDIDTIKLVFATDASVLLVPEGVVDVLVEENMV